MVEPDVIVDKWGCPEFQVILNHKEHNRVLEDCGIQIMGSHKREMGESDRDGGGDESHVQEVFKRCQNDRGLIYPGNDPE